MNIISYAIGLNSGGSKEPVLESISITANGTYTPDAGIDGYNSVSVNVPQDGAPTAEELTFTGDCTSRFQNGIWDWVIRLYGNSITTSNITNADSMFRQSKVSNIPFEIQASSSVNAFSMAQMFQGVPLTIPPTIKNANPTILSYLFTACYFLRTIPEDYTNTWSWSNIEAFSVPYGGYNQSMFRYCYSLRSFPIELISHGNSYLTNNSFIANGYHGCASLDELILPDIYFGTSWNSNYFSENFKQCYRAKKVVFTHPHSNDAQSYIRSWANQTIDLTNVGWSDQQEHLIIDYNSGITADKKVSDAATYEALKNDADWYTLDANYSRYNHDSAVETINSLPDTSAYLAERGGTNTIKFNGESGKLTDGGAINTLTEEEIAVATARGWTVSFN